MSTTPHHGEPRPGASAPDVFRAAIASQDEGLLRKAIDAWAEQVRDAKDDHDADALADACEPLASHASAKVRQAVADAADVAPEGAFDRWLARFSADDDHYVRSAIARAAKRRAARRKKRAKENEHEKLVADLLFEMESKYGKAARRLAERTVRRGTEYFVRQLHHEAAKTVTPLQYSLHKLRTAVTLPDLDRAGLTHHVGIAWNRLEHLWSVVDQAREATATLTPHFVDEPLLPLVQAARSKLVTRLGARAGKLAFVTDVDPNLRLDFDPPRLLQALENFCQNAAEAYGDDAAEMHMTVAARLLRAGSEVEMTITDRGAGMTQERLGNLFVPFGSRKTGGTGLGLIIARAMIEQLHGGTLTFTSAPGVGTTVTCVLPTRQAGRRKS